jgi:UDP-N-acetylmuramate--alanine ligase
MLNFAMKGMRHIHFVGIGGAGMSGIAEVMHTLGFEISGSDLHESETTARLKRLGITIHIGHCPLNISVTNPDFSSAKKVDLLVLSTAVKSDNVEVEAARLAGTPMISRAEMLAELMRFRYGIAVSGTHGKTTVTSMLAFIFSHAGLDPTYVIGGKVNSFTHHAQLGKGKYFIAEADESDASFLRLSPMAAIITNIDEDHMQTYDNDLERLKTAFVEFGLRLPFYGLLVGCVDDPIVLEVMASIGRKSFGYGFSEKANYQAKEYEIKDGLSAFTVAFDSGECDAFLLPLPGKHNVLNALAAITISHQLGVTMEKIAEALAKFPGIARRFDLYKDQCFENVYIDVIDDYGHHPVEIMATMESVKALYPKRRIIHVFQPHRYTRTRDLFNEMLTSLSHADQLILLDTYPAGESLIIGATSADLAKSLDDKGVVVHEVSDVSEAHRLLGEIIQRGDVLVIQGAGDIANLVSKLV